MSRRIRGIGMVMVILSLFAATGEQASAGGQMPADSAALLQFQRAADAYAFAHRRTERRHDPTRPAVEGTLFTPTVAAAFRSRIAAAVKAGCDWPKPPADSYVVPAVNTDSASSPVLPACLVARLPKLPEELEYRVAGAALLLSDAHLKVVVDVLHAAYPRTGDN